MTLSPLGDPLNPPKRVKRGHLLSDYRQKCVNGTRDSYCGVKSPFLSDLRLILTHIVVSKDSYWLILWCQKSISEWFETHIVVSKVHFWVIWESGKFGLKKGTGVDPHPPLVDNVPFFYRLFKMRASLTFDIWAGIYHSLCSWELAILSPFHTITGLSVIKTCSKLVFGFQRIKHEWAVVGCAGLWWIAVGCTGL